MISMSGSETYDMREQWGLSSETVAGTQVSFSLTRAFIFSIISCAFFLSEDIDLHLYLQAVIGKVDLKMIGIGVVFQVFSGVVQEAVKGFIIVGMFTVKQAEAFYPG